MPSVWRADELARPVGAVVASGHALLDAQLPAGGWPVGALVEVLQAQNHGSEWRLLLPALARTCGAVLLVGAPYQPYGPGLAGQGLDPQRLLCITAQSAVQRLWASEQALRCADVVAVLAWLPQVRADQLRRLHMAASNHAKLLFVMRPQSAREESSPAVLRLLVTSPQTQGQEQGRAQCSSPDNDALELHLLKRRGPPLEHPLILPARAARLAMLLSVSHRRSARMPEQQKPAPLKPVPLPARVSVLAPAQIPVQMPNRSGGASHALDRIAAAA